MIKGNIEIFQSYGDKHKSLYKGSNMVVDGFRKTIADVMTYMPNPSGTVQMELGTSSVSSYQIQAMTLGSAKKGYSQRDSRFWYSGMATSAGNYQLLPVTDNAVFEMWDCYSSIGFNQWKYDTQVDANLLVNPTLNSTSGWTVNFLYDLSAGMMTKTTDITSEGEINITKFELVAGQEQATLRQTLPEMKEGGVYTCYTNGKAHNANMDIRISRGQNNVPLEYYDFSTEKFVIWDKNNKNLSHTVKLKNFYNIDEFRFRLQGNEKDQLFQPNNEYYVEYVFPSTGFVDEGFAPWDFNYVNPYINIARLEVCDERHQILRNPNFLEHQSLLVNNDFDIIAKFPDTEVKNADACAQAGLYKLPGWKQINPFAEQAENPTSREDNPQFGAVFPLSKNQKAIKQDQLNGVALYASSVDISSSGTAAIQQTFHLGNEYKNPFAFVDNNSSNPELLAAANGQYDNNKTLMLSFDTMVSGEAPTAANCGNLQITLIRNSDGYEYSFTPQSRTLQNDIWIPNGNAYNVSYAEKNTWYSKGVQVVLPPDAHQETYTINIAGTGRSDGTNGFCYYLIRNFSFGSLAGWRTYVYDHSGIAKWSLSSAGARVKSGNIFSGLTLSATRYDSLAGTANDDITASVNGTNVPAKTQLVQNFVGLEPTKTYRLAVKGTYLSDTTTVPQFKYSLKAKARTKPETNNYNILSTWMQDNSGAYSALNTPTNLNPYYTNTDAHRATHPFFSKSLNTKSSTPLDWGLWVDASGSSEANSTTAPNLAANAGSYTLSMKVFNSLDAPSYFVLSSMDGGMGYPSFFNWETAEWEVFVANTVPAYRNSVSGAYFLPLPSGANTDNFTSYTYPNPVVLPHSPNGKLRTYTHNTPDNLGSAGDYRLTAAIYGPNAEAGSTLISDLALKGPGLGTNVDIWKELYYNFTAGDWQPTPIQAQDYHSEDTNDTNESFISCPLNLISNMALFGLDRDTEYQINIIDAGGGIYTIHDISLQDVAFVANSGRSRWIRDASKWTSEPYGNLQYDSYTDGAVFKLRNENNGTNLLTDTTSPSAMTSWRTPASLMFRATSGYTGNPTTSPIFVPVMRIENETSQTFAMWLTQNFTLGEYALKSGDMFAIGLEGISLNRDTDSIEMSIAAKYDGVRYQYNPETKEWAPGKEQRTLSFSLYNRDAQFKDEYYADAKSWNQLLSPPIVAPLFGPNTKITASFMVNAGGTEHRDIDIKDFKVYKWTDASSNHYRVSGTTFNFPEFPTPTDITLQSTQPSGHPGQLGQFLNRINFFNYYPSPFNVGSNRFGEPASGLRAINNPMSPSITGEKTLEEAVSMGAFLPSAGLFFGSGTYGLQNSQQPWGLAPSGGLVSGVLNQMGVVNSDGYIYRHPYTPTNNDARDASAGFIVSSYQNGAGTYKHKTIRYILKLHRDDWRFLDYYMGGLGALGLNTLDYKKSYAKLGTAFQLSGTGASYSPGSRVGLYKIADPSRNPVFNLTNKKVTFPPGLKIDYNNTDYITIIWDINY